MKQIFFIIDNKKKYYSKSISGYKKKLLMKAFEKCLKTNNLYNSLYFGFEIIASGYFNDFWLIILTILSENIHILSPNLPSEILSRYEYFKNLEKRLRKRKIILIEMRNLLEIQKHIVFVIKNIVSSKQKHASYFIKPSYNHQQKRPINQRKVLLIFKRFQQLVSTTINNKITYKGNTDTLLNEIFHSLGQIMVIDCDSINNLDYPYNINLYHHTKSKLHENIISIFWNILLKKSKINKNIWTQISALYKIHKLKVTHKLEKESYHILNAFFYFIYNLEDIPIQSITKQEIMFVERFYSNIQAALNSGGERVDYLIIEDKNKKTKKKPKKTQINFTNNIKVANSRVFKNKISKNNIRMFEVKPDVSVSKIIKENKISKTEPINPSQVFNDIEHKEALKTEEEHYEDPYFQFIANQSNQTKQNNKAIDVIIKGEGENQKTEDFLDFLFNFEDVATIEETDSKKVGNFEHNNYHEEIRQISISEAAYYGKKKSNRRRHTIIKV